MTKSIGLNSSGDIYLDTSGSLSIVTGIVACEQNCQTAMLAQRGEMMYAQQDGIPYRAVVWDRYNPKLFEAAARKTLLSVPDVLSGQSFTQSVVNGKLSYTATIKTIYGVTTISA